MSAAQGFRFVDPIGDFLLNRQCRIQSWRSDKLKQQRFNGLIDMVTTNRLTQFACLTHRCLCTLVVGFHGSTHLLIAHPHSGATESTEYPPLQ